MASFELVSVANENISCVFIWPKGSSRTNDPRCLIICPFSMRVSFSSLYLMFFLSVQNVGSAMADVFIDAMIAEALRAEKASLSDLQSVSGCAVTVGGICGSLLGGYALNNLKMETICLLFTVLPALQLLSSIFNTMPLIKH
ncbi:hypothetical protein Bca52824_052208 [Brassica carinata]|uniref:Uncharacterized protein n=1 Tax=Brassica carinata TaxID=52824 RepID=A0A8X7R1N6_BRACI|nr:hypothetical protein Bca52824_052208 [Brassica carinata]